MASFDYDVIVIGSGAGGSVAAQQIAKSGKSVALVEASNLGGQVLNHSSIPTKALLHAASAFETAKRGSAFGIRATTVGYNYPSVKAWKDTVLRLTKKAYSEDTYINQGISVIKGKAYFLDNQTISIGSARFTAKNFVIATGSDLVLPEIAGLSKAGFLTHKEAIDLIRPPKNLAVIGGGETGVEFAQLFAIFGSKVTIVESSGSLIGNEEPETSELLENRFRKEYGMSILLNTNVTSVSKSGLKRSLQLARGSKTGQLVVDEVLLATGKQAVVDIGLENAGVTHSPSQIKTNRYQQTSAKNIFAIGDCAGPYHYTHAAAYQGQVVAHNIVHPRMPVEAKYKAIPRSIFTNPQVASTGLTERQIKDHKIQYKSVVTPISVVAKSATSGFYDGFIKVMASKENSVILGATIVCPEASELIGELSLAIQHNLTAQQVAHTVHSFGTWSEIIRVACAKLSKTD